MEKPTIEFVVAIFIRIVLGVKSSVVVVLIRNRIF